MCPRLTRQATLEAVPHFYPDGPRSRYVAGRIDSWPLLSKRRSTVGGCARHVVNKQFRTPSGSPIEGYTGIRDDARWHFPEKQRLFVRRSVRECRRMVHRAGRTTVVCGIRVKIDERIGVTNGGQ